MRVSPEKSNRSFSTYCPPLTLEPLARESPARELTPETFASNVNSLLDDALDER